MNSFDLRAWLTTPNEHGIPRYKYIPIIANGLNFGGNVSGNLLDIMWWDGMLYGLKLAGVEDVCEIVDELKKHEDGIASWERKAK